MRAAGISSPVVGLGQGWRFMQTVLLSDYQMQICKLFSVWSAKTQQQIEFGDPRTKPRSVNEIARDNMIGKMAEAAVCNMSAQEWGNMMLTLALNDYHWSSTLIWNKDQLVLSRKDYHTKYEPIWYGWKSGEARLHPLEDRKQCDVWDFERPKRSDEHPTMKPVALVARAIQNSSNRGDSVLDLFGGSGTTLIACEETDRNCFMMELDPHYVDVIIKRWENMTGEKAARVNV